MAPSAKRIKDIEQNFFVLFAAFASAALLDEVGLEQADEFFAATFTSQLGDETA